jgi:hypothetical protein
MVVIGTVVPCIAGCLRVIVAIGFRKLLATKFATSLSASLFDGPDGEFCASGNTNWNGATNGVCFGDFGVLMNQYLSTVLNNLRRDDNFPL